MSKKQDSDGRPYPSTTSFNRIVSGDYVLWSNFQGTKTSHNLGAT